MCFSCIRRVIKLSIEKNTSKEDLLSEKKKPIVFLSYLSDERKKHSDCDNDKERHD